MHIESYLIYKKHTYVFCTFILLRVDSDSSIEEYFMCVDFDSIMEADI